MSVEVYAQEEQVSVSVPSMISAEEAAHVTELAEQAFANSLNAVNTANSHAESNKNPHGITIAQIGAAPAGYGLGEPTGRYASDLNSAVTGGLWWTNGDTKNLPSSAITYSIVFVKKRLNGEIVQEIQSMDGNKYELTRWSTDGGATWRLEWKIPPMFPGVEYRTTERWNGKPVYTMLINCGNMPTAGNTNRIDMPSTIYGWVDRVLRVNGTDSSGNSIPYSWQGEYITEVSANRSAIYIYAKDDYSSNTADVQIWYVRHQEG